MAYDPDAVDTDGVDVDDELPPRTATKQRTFEILINGELVGVCDQKLPIGAVLDLEDAARVNHLIDWLLEWGTADAAHDDLDTWKAERRQQIKSVLRPLPQEEIAALIREISKAISRGTTVPKAKRRR